MTDAPEDPLPPEIQALMDEAYQYPNSEWRQSRLLGSFLGGELESDPRRIQLILDYIPRFPRSATAKCPIVHIDPAVSSDAFRAIESVWLALRNDDADDPDLAIGHAALVANGDPSRSADILRTVIQVLPENPDLWTELGRVAPEPLEQLRALEKARALGSRQPNLLVWIGRAAVKANQLEVVMRVGQELEERATKTRTTVDSPIGWSPGRGAWTRIRAAIENSPDRRHLVSALSQYANDTHWSNIFLGLVAAQDDLAEAAKRLRRSAEVWDEPRLSAYGPSFLLAKKLCETGYWEEVEAFLIACKDFWDESVLDDWILDVRSARVPDFDDWN